MHPDLLIALARQHRRFEDDARRIDERGQRQSGVAASIAGRARHAMGWILVEAGLRLAMADRDGFTTVKAQ
jgi:hypothetical protein